MFSVSSEEMSAMKFGMFFVIFKHFSVAILDTWKSRSGYSIFLFDLQNRIAYLFMKRNVNVDYASRDVSSSSAVGHEHLWVSFWTPQHHLRSQGITPVLRNSLPGVHEYKSQPARCKANTRKSNYIAVFCTEIFEFIFWHSVYSAK